MFLRGGQVAWQRTVLLACLITGCLGLPGRADSFEMLDARSNSSAQVSQAENNGPRLPPPSKLKPGTRLTRGTIVRVGPRSVYRTPSDAAKIAKDGDTIEIEAGIYEGDAAVWIQNNLTLRGVGGRAHIEAAGSSAEGKAIWVIKGDNTTVENIEFSGAKVPSRNGAGIRLEGKNLIVRRSWFHHNENAILTGRIPESDILVEYCRIYSNTVDPNKNNKYSHNLYIGRVHSFTLRNSYIQGAQIGHNVKSRATNNFIINNRIMDEIDGGSSYLIDLPNGGTAYVLGNLFHQSNKNDNYTFISYGAEGIEDQDGRLNVANNTFVNDDDSGLFIRNFGTMPAEITNNLFVGPGRIISGPGRLEGNLATETPGFVNRDSFDYRLRKDSPAVDAGVNPSDDLLPKNIYVHPTGVAPRRTVGPVDVGAYELIP